MGRRPEGAITILLQRPWSTAVEDLIRMIQYEFNHHLLHPDCQKGCVSIANSGFDFFTPAREKHIQNDCLTIGGSEHGWWAFCPGPMY